jgi:hypothetical protein
LYIEKRYKQDAERIQPKIGEVPTEAPPAEPISDPIAETAEEVTEAI